ncbi:MAG: ATPase [Ruminococcaceae bacterium]|nr:ATPase [Oscillospiraceae bacterium]
MTIDKYLDRIDDVLEEAWNLPFTGGKRMVDIEKIRELVDEVRLNIPQEIKDAKAIVRDREDIIKDANAEAEEIIKKAEERARRMISQEEVMISAREKAGELLTETHVKTRAAEKAVLDYSESALRKAEEVLLAVYNEIKNTRTMMRSGKLKNPKNEAK